MNPFDTIYELAGFQLAGHLWEAAVRLGVPAVVGLAGLAWVVRDAADRGSPKDILVQLGFLILACGLLARTDAGEAKTPRFAAWVNAAADAVQVRAIRSVNDRFLTDPYEWERLAAMSGSARLRSPSLAKDVEAFLAGCGRTTLASHPPPEVANLLRPQALGYAASCEKRRAVLWKRVQDHVRGDPWHAQVLAIARKRDAGAFDRFLDRYVDAVVLRSIDEPDGPVGEAALVAASLGSYEYFSAAQRTDAGGRSFDFSVLGGFGPLQELFVTAFAQVSQAASNRLDAKQRYYQATVYGPHFYGVALMLTAAFFPVAATAALWPGRWTALVHWSEVFVSIKLWPVGWAVLTRFNERRGILEALDEPERGGADVFLVIAGSYLLVPALAFAMVRLGSAAARAPFERSAPGPAGAGAAGPVMAAASRAVK